MMSILEYIINIIKSYLIRTRAKEGFHVEENTTKAISAHPSKELTLFFVYKPPWKDRFHQ